ncbi:protein PFC0760c-like [Vespula squamosa]|uniref:Protein PFC0760c-like n=1 Tax=Vespula squamosa TaxID=30214 RepID=A0ABD2BMT8_VESSQ
MQIIEKFWHYLLDNSISDLLRNLILILRYQIVSLKKRSPLMTNSSRLYLHLIQAGDHGGGVDVSGNKHVVKGGGSKHEEDHHESKGEKNDEGYEKIHEYETGEKGHHDKENHERSYDEKDGQDKKKHEESGHYSEHHHGVKGEKNAKFEEEGKHQKGHSTKGEHSIFKKDEYEKKHDFYDEYHEDGDQENHGAYHKKHEATKGNHEKKGHHDSDYNEYEHGKESKHEKGYHSHDQKGKKSAEGHDDHHHHDEKYGKKEGQSSGKKWLKKSKHSRFSLRCGLGGGVMGTYRRSMAIWLSLFLYLLGQSRISKAGVQRNSKNRVENILLEEIVLARRNNTTKLLGAAAIENPIKANERILSLINGKSDLVFPNYNPVQDQSIAQSQAVIVSLNDTKDLENLDHVLAFSGYEPQKVNLKKDKRKVLDNFNNDRVTSSRHIKTTDSSTVLPYVKTQYDVPRRFQSNRKNSNEGHHPSTASYQKVSQPITQTDPNVIVVNTETLRKKFAIKNHALPRVYKPKEELSTIEVTKPTYHVPTRKLKNDESKIKKNIDENVSVRPKLQKIRKKVKNFNVVTLPLVTTPLSVYNYTVLNRMVNNHKLLLESPIVQPVASQKINNILYQNDSLTIDNQPDLKRQESASKSDSELGISKKYNVIPRPFSYSTKHSGNIKKVQITSINSVTPKNIIGTKESLIANDSKVNPMSNYEDKINLLGANQETTYNYRKESPTEKQRENYEKFESNIDDASSSRSNLMSEESIDNNENIGKSNKHLQRRNDSYEVSESASLEDDSDSDNADFDHPESYEFPEISEKENDYYDNSDKKDVRHSQSVESHKDDQNYETSNLKKADHDSNYEETKYEKNQDHVSKEYQVKNNDQGDDQDEDGAHNYEHVEKSENSAGGGGDGGGGDSGGEKEFTKGGEVEQKEDYYKKQGNKEEKAYKIWHGHDKAKKGYHDKEQHNKEYEEKDGEKKEHGEDGEYYQDYYQDEKGKKETEFNEKGEHKKGHNTKGEHSVHKKDEYVKKTEFFDEFHEDGDSEKDGGYYSKHEAEKGGKMKSGHYDKAFKEDKYGNSKEYEESEYHDEEKGKGSKQGQESHYDHEKKYKEKGTHESGKKWMMDSGDGSDGKDGGSGNKKGSDDDKHGR